MTAMLPLLFLLQASSPPPIEVDFQAPPGWVPVDASPLRAFTPPRPGNGEVVLLALFPAEQIGSPAGFAAWFNQRLVNPGETILQQSATERRPVGGQDILTVTQRVTLPDGMQMVRVFYGISVEGRVALAMLTANRDDLVTRHAEPARAFFESLRFTGNAGAPVPADASLAGAGPAGGNRVAIPPAGYAGGEPRGIFYRLWTGALMETRTRVFLPGRRMLRIEPQGGAGMDLGRCSPDTCGSYRIEGPWLTVQWDNGDTQRLSYSRTAEELNLDGEAFRPARALTAAEAAGTWVNPAAGGSGEGGLHLGGDGAFVWSGGTRATTLRGRYTLQGLALTLAFEDGTSRQYTVFAAGRSRPAGLLSLDGTVYSRK